MATYEDSGRDSTEGSSHSVALTVTGTGWHVIGIFISTNTASGVTFTCNGDSTALWTGTSTLTSDQNSMSLKYNVTSGTTLTVAASYTGGNAYDMRVVAWSESAEPTLNDSAIDYTQSSATLAVTIDSASGDNVIAWGSNSFNSATGSWTNSTYTMTEDVDDTTNEIYAAHANSVSSQTGATVQLDLSASFGVDDSLQAVSYSVSGGASPAAGSASGTGSASGVGASTAASAGSSSGTGVATGAASSTAAAAGSSDGVATVTGAGTGINPADGSAAGTSTVSGAGASGTVADGTATGTSTATAVGASTAASDGTASGTGAASGVGASTAESAGSAAGVATVTGAGSSTSGGEAVGTASGSATVIGAGASTAEASGSAAGSAGVSGAGATVGGDVAGDYEDKKRRRDKNYLKAVEAVLADLDEPKIVDADPVNPPVKRKPVRKAPVTPQAANKNRQALAAIMMVI